MEGVVEEELFDADEPAAGLKLPLRLVEPPPPVPLPLLGRFEAPPTMEFLFPTLWLL